MDALSTYPFQAKCIGNVKASVKGSIVIEDDVWIGYGATILSGVTLGRGCVVGARALVCKDVPPYAIVAGIPAKIIKYRFDEDVRNELLEFDYDAIDEGFCSDHIDLLDRTLSEDVFAELKALTE